MATTEPLAPQALRRHCDPQQFDFETTAELAGDPEIIGQPRALEAVNFGIGMRHQGYNIFALGPEGTGKQFLVEHSLKRQADKLPAPKDTCYVHNFGQPNKPRLLRLPAGTAARFQQDMKTLVDEISSSLRAAFESEEYQTRRQSIEEEFGQRSSAHLNEIRQEAEVKGFALLRTPMGMMFAPVKDGQALTAEAFDQLPEEEKKRLQGDLEELQQRLQKALRDLPRQERERRNRIRDLDHETIDFAVGHLFDELREAYTELPEVVSYLEGVRQDFSENAGRFLQAAALAEKGGQESSTLLRRYAVNVLIDNGSRQGVPVLFENHPTYQNLVGRIEYSAQMGTLVTDFNLIQPGALHRANGGYLILEARKLLQQPYAWEGLKRTLKSRRIRIEPLGQALSLVSTVSLEPEPAPLDLKVVLLGDRSLYYLLCAYDPEFAELFKVEADFEENIDRNEEHQQGYARLIAGLAGAEGLRPFHRNAVARIIEQSSRLTGDAEKLSARTGMLADLLREADHWAGVVGNSVVAAADVDKAIAAQIRRADRFRERLQEAIYRGTIYIDTEGSKVGQINGLSVIQLGSFAFGRPNRISARVRLGKGEVIDIEREVDLSGPLHSKGVLILAGFLGATYAGTHPLSLSASLVFEQSYGGIDGDSASSTELYVLLSAIAEIPIKQSLAVTGSVNQHGEVQPIGGVNEKIEGFFDLCAARGLSGDQGVLIPAANVQHLMLRDDVVAAVAAEKFHIYAVTTIDEGLELLTGLPAGERDEAGAFPEGSVNYLVGERLKAMTEAQIALARSAREDNHGV